MLFQDVSWLDKDIMKALRNNRVHKYLSLYWIPDGVRHLRRNTVVTETASLQPTCHPRHRSVS